MSNRWRIALGLVTVLWVAAFFVGYFYTHKPITFDQLPGFGRLALTLAAWLGTLVAAHALGQPLERMVEGTGRRDGFVLRLGFGFGLLGLIVLAMGALRLYRPAVAWVLLLVGIAVGIRAFARDLPGLLPRLPASRADRFLAAFVVLSLGLSFAAALAPPTAWDSLVYHLTGPKLYIAAGRLHQDIDLPYLGFPHWPAMLYTWALLLAAPAGAQLIHFTFALMTLALLPGLVGEVAPGRAWLAAALLVSAPALMLLAGWAYVEWLTLFAVAAGMTALLHWQRTAQARWLAAAGAFAGLAFAAKYTTAGAILGLGLAVLLAAGGDNSGEAMPAHESWWRAGLTFGGVALLVAAPWLLKNLALTGNPVYPFFFPGKFWDAFRAEWFGRPGTGLNLLQTLAAPWTLMVGGAGVEDVGPLLPALPLLLVIGWSRRTPESRRAARLMVVACFAALVVWMVGLAGSRLLFQYRLLYPIFPLVAVLGAAAFDGLAAASTPALRPRWVVGGLIALALTLNLGGRLLSFVRDNPLPVALGIEAQPNYLANQLGVYALAMEAVNSLAPNSQSLVFLWEPRSYYCAAGCEPDAILDRWWHLRRTVGGAAAIAARWRSEGVTHVLLFETGRDFVEREGFDPFTADDWAELNRLIADELAPLSDVNGAYQLYSLRVQP